MVGVPYNEPGRRISSGGNSETTDSESAAERFAAELESRYQMPVIRVDERLSSAEAEYRLRDQRRSGIRQRKVRSGDVDAVAACVIAETWLDQPAPNKLSTDKRRTMDRPHRGTIYCIDARVIEQQAWPDKQFIVRLHAPDCARTATPGTFVHVCCNPDIPMRRPLSIMRVSASEGWIEVLYKVVGHGLTALSRAEPGDLVNLLGPIGHGFRPDPARPQAVLIGGGVGIPPLVFLAGTLAPLRPQWPFSAPKARFPLRKRPRSCPCRAYRPAASACMPRLEDTGHRIATGQQGRPAR